MKRTRIGQIGSAALLYIAAFAVALIMGCHKGDFAPVQRLRATEPQAQTNAVVQKISFRAGGNSESCRLSGWSIPEQDHIWTEGNSAELRFNGLPIGAALRIEALVSGAVNGSSVPKQIAEVYANGNHVGQWQIGATPQRVTTELPPLGESSGGTLLIEFRVLHPLSPATEGLGSDTRLLGISFSELLLVRA